MQKALEENDMIELPAIDHSAEISARFKTAQKSMKTAWAMFVVVRGDVIKGGLLHGMCMCSVYVCVCLCLCLCLCVCVFVFCICV